MHEATSLLPKATNTSSSPARQHETKTNQSLKILAGLGVLTVLLAMLLTTGTDGILRSSMLRSGHQEEELEEDFVWTVPLLGRVRHNRIHEEAELVQSLNETVWEPPEPQRRCRWVANTFLQRDEGESYLDLKAKYSAQSADINVFYRATAHIFWKDFVLEGWGDGLKLVEFDQRTRPATIKGVVLHEKSLWTWVTGDQHLSNFGAWRNRNGKVVFSVNDFDEAAIYDFQIDVFRIAVSILSHAYTNGFTTEEADLILKDFTDSYVRTTISYVGNENANLYELTKRTSFGKLREFLIADDSKDAETQATKFTTIHNASGGIMTRRFIKGPSVDVPDANTRLAPVHDYREKQIRDAFTSTRYGATMMYLGWAVPQWDPIFFQVLDVAARIGSGIGSFGVNRYYVLLKGTDDLLSEGEGNAVILDVKFEPDGAVTRVLSLPERARYDVLFKNEADRAVQGQRRLTSYVDPFTGYINLPDKDGIDRAFVVRQRSPWKADLDLATLARLEDFEEYVIQIGVATATSHTRGTAAKAPGEFKDAIRALLRKKKDRKRWGKAVAKLSHAYRGQLKLDFECFQDFVKTNYS